MTAPWQVRGVPEELRRKLKSAAAEKGFTIGGWLTEAIIEKLDREKPEAVQEMMIQKKIGEAKTLDQLCDALNDYKPERCGGLKLDEVVDITSLPVFGSLSVDSFQSEVVDTDFPVWSWDDSRAIIDGDGDVAFRIVTHDYLRE